MSVKKRRTLFRQQDFRSFWWRTSALFRCILFALLYSTGTCSSRIVGWGDATRSTEATRKIHMANSSARKRRRLWENRYKIRLVSPERHRKSSTWVPHVSAINRFPFAFQYCCLIIIIITMFVYYSCSQNATESESSYHQNRPVTISVPVAMASPSLLYPRSSCAKTSWTVCYTMIYINVNFCFLSLVISLTL